MTLVGYTLVLLAAVLTMAANLLLRMGIDRAGGFTPTSFAEIFQGLVRLFLQPHFAAGFVFYFLASIVWFRVVASQPLSVAYPILVSLTFTFVTFGAVVVFGESLSLRKVAGLVIILAGILVVSFDKGLS